MGRGGERGRALRWGGLLAVVGLGLAGVAPARADASRVVLFYGDPGPFAELLAAELALVEGELRPGPIPAPRDGLEAQALRAELDAFAVIRALPAEIVLWVPGAEGQLRELRLRPHDDPGMAPLILAETIRAAPEWRTPSLPPRVAEPRTGDTDLEWVEASGEGVVYSTTVMRPRPPAAAYNVALIDLAEGARMMSRVEGPAPEEVTIGMKVRARIAQGEDGPLVVFDPA